MFTSSVLPERIPGLGHKTTLIAQKSSCIEMSGLHVSLCIARKIETLPTHWTGEATTWFSNHKALDVIIQPWKLSFITALKNSKVFLAYISLQGTNEFFDSFFCISFLSLCPWCHALTSCEWQGCAWSCANFPLVLWHSLQYHNWTPLWNNVLTLCVSWCRAYWWKS